MYLKTNLYLDNQDIDLTKMASELYKSKGYTVIKNYLPLHIVNKLVSAFVHEDIIMFPLKDDIKNKNIDIHNFSVKYFYFNRCKKTIPLFYDFILKIYNLRNKISLQNESDLISYEYAKRKKIININDLSLSQLTHSFIRFAWYKDANGQNEHLDNIGELQCILPLTHKNKDYNTGGLYVKDLITNEYTDIDSQVEPGDLIILNAYRCTHRVEPISKDFNQIGRLHLFIPVIPEWAFSRNKYYFFKQNNFKLFFTNKSDNNFIKIAYFIEHILSLNFLKKSIDQSSFKKESNKAEKDLLNTIFKF